jgi:16S rRNA (uracil1498-N3)-methyltransferase
VERDDLASLAGFFSSANALEPGTTILLGEDAAHHARVRRLEAGAPVYVADGKGAQATGSIVRLGKKDLDIALADVQRSPRPPGIHLLVPIADRDRMLWCAEKCTELGVSSWRPVMWNRSRSVSPRGEGQAFAQRVRARMTSALIQAHAAWLPELRDDAAFDDVLTRLPINGTRLVLDASGTPIAREGLEVPVTIAVGPEGGFEPGEIQALRDASFRVVSLGANILRLETAAVAAVAIVSTKLGSESNFIIRTQLGSSPDGN